eukprot:102869-Prymnesium_polylepis.1
MCIRDRLHLAPRVDEDDRLRDREALVEVAQALELVLLEADVDVVLADAVERLRLALYEDARRVRRHELLRQLEHLRRQRCREECDVRLLRDEPQDLRDLLLEALGEHLVGLVEHEVVECRELERAALHHVQHAAGRRHHQVHACAQPLDARSHADAADRRERRAALH